MAQKTAAESCRSELPRIDLGTSRSPVGCSWTMQGGRWWSLFTASAHPRCASRMRLRAGMDRQELLIGVLESSFSLTIPPSSFPFSTNALDDMIIHHGHSIVTACLAILSFWIVTYFISHCLVSGNVPHFPDYSIISAAALSNPVCISHHIMFTVELMVCASSEWIVFSQASVSSVGWLFGATVACQLIHQGVLDSALLMFSCSMAMGRVAGRNIYKARCPFIARSSLLIISIIIYISISLVRQSSWSITSKLLFKSSSLSQTWSHSSQQPFLLSLQPQLLELSSRKKPVRTSLLSGPSLISLSAPTLTSLEDARTWRATPDNAVCLLWLLPRPSSCWKEIIDGA